MVSICGCGLKEGMVSTHISLWINLHLRHGIVVLHVLFGDVAAVLHRFNTLAQLVGLDASRIDGRFGDKRHACGGDERLAWLAREIGEIILALTANMGRIMTGSTVGILN
jgi:hypothetical protein